LGVGGGAEPLTAASRVGGLPGQIREMLLGWHRRFVAPAFLVHAPSIVHALSRFTRARGYQIAPDLATDCWERALEPDRPPNELCSRRNRIVGTRRPSDSLDARAAAQLLPHTRLTRRRLHACHDSRPEHGRYAHPPYVGRGERIAATIPSGTSFGASAPPDGELRILIAVEDLLEGLGRAPTVREIGMRAGWSSVGSVAEYLDKLKARRLLVVRGRSLRRVND
jgi:hypothetical protein